MESDSLKPQDKPIHEEANSFLDNIKTEWSLFWHGLIGDEEVDVVADPFQSGRLQVLTIEQIKQITRALSSDRKKINQRIEQINKEIDSNTEKIENLKLVGGDVQEALEQINTLTDIGQQLSLQLQKVNDQLKKFRLREDLLKTKAN